MENSSYKTGFYRPQGREGLLNLLFESIWVQLSIFVTATVMSLID